MQLGLHIMDIVVVRGTKEYYLNPLFRIATSFFDSFHRTDKQ
jgi:hypothetical protein